MKQIFAQSPDQGLGCGQGFGPIAQFLCSIQRGDPQATAQVGGQFNKVISMVIGLMTIIAALYFLFQFIIAGYQWLSSGGEKSNLEQARDKITNSFIGLIIVVAAWIIVGVVGKMLGLEILNPGAVLQNLTQ